jgi:hypothetical protein
MARYRVRYGDVAEEQRSQLPHSVRTVFEARIEDLRRDPYLVGDYDKRQGWYSTTFGEMGLIFYVASDKIDTVTVTRVFWLK